MRKKIFCSVSALVAVLMVFASCSGKNNSGGNGGENKAAAEKAAQEAVQTAALEAELEAAEEASREAEAEYFMPAMTVRELNAAYSGNAVKADLDYKGKRVKINGYISDIGESGGVPYVRLVAGFDENNLMGFLTNGEYGTLDHGPAIRVTLKESERAIVAGKSKVDTNATLSSTILSGGQKGDTEATIIGTCNGRTSGDISVSDARFWTAEMETAVKERLDAANERVVAARTSIGAILLRRIEQEGAVSIPAELHGSWGYTFSFVDGTVEVIETYTTDTRTIWAKVRFQDRPEDSYAETTTDMFTSVTPAANTDNGTKAEYPAGWTLEGVMTAYERMEGKPMSRELQKTEATYFINAAKTKIALIGENNDGSTYFTIYTKQ